MRYSANNRVVSFALLGPGILCAAALYLKAHLVETQARLPLGRYTAERVIQRSEPLYEFLVLHPEKVSLTAFRMETFSRSGTVRRAWEVEASDPMQRMLVHFSWDADTGELRSVTAASQPLDGGKFRIDNKDAAVRNARYWMDAWALRKPSASGDSTESLKEDPKHGSFAGKQESIRFISYLMLCHRVSLRPKVTGRLLIFRNSKLHYVLV